MLFSIPLFSYELIRQQLLGNVNLKCVLTYSFKSLLMLGPLYSAFAAYFLYIPKERYWEKLEEKKMKYKSIQDLVESKPIHRLNLDKNK